VRIDVLNGVNLNLLGRRDQSIYGSQSIQDLETQIYAWARELDLQVRCRQTNNEGEYVGFLHQALGHNLLSVLRIHVFRVFGNFARRSFIGDDLLGSEILLGSQGAAFNHRIRNLAGEQADGAQGVIVTRDHIVDLVGIAIRIHHSDHGDAQLAGFFDGDGFFVRIDHEHHVGQALHVLNAGKVLV